MKRSDIRGDGSGFRCAPPGLRAVICRSARLFKGGRAAPRTVATDREGRGRRHALRPQQPASPAPRSTARSRRSMRQVETNIPAVRFGVSDRLAISARVWPPPAMDRLLNLGRTGPRSLPGLDPVRFRSRRLAKKRIIIHFYVILSWPNSALTCKRTAPAVFSTESTQTGCPAAAGAQFHDASGRPKHVSPGRERSLRSYLVSLRR